MTTPVETPEAIVEKDFTSIEGLEESLKLVSPELRDLFEKCDAAIKADAAFTTSTVGFIKRMTELGNPFEGLVEKIEEDFKAMGLWPTYFNEKTKEELFVSINDASKAGVLAARIRKKVKTMLDRCTPILDEDGALQFWDVDCKPVIMSEENTTSKGEFTRTSKKADKRSVAEEKAARENAETNARPQTGGGGDTVAETESAEDSEVQSNEAARMARQTLELIGKSFGVGLTHIMAVQKIHESHRAELAKTKAGKEYLEAMAGHFDQIIQNQEDLADVLGIVHKDGHYIVKKAV